MTAAPLEFEKPLVELERKLEDLKRHLNGQDVNVDPEVRRIAERIEKFSPSVLVTSLPFNNNLDCLSFL